MVEEGTNHSPYLGKCGEQDEYEDVLAKAGVPRLEQDHLNVALAAPRAARFMNARAGSVIRTHFHGNPFGWSPSYSQLSVKLTLRRVR